MCHPHQRVLIHEARHGPIRIELIGVERVPNDTPLRAGSALAHAEGCAHLSHAHSGLPRRVREEVDLSEHVDDRAGPGPWLSRGNRAWSLSAQGCGHSLSQFPITLIEVMTTELI